MVKMAKFSKREILDVVLENDDVDAGVQYIIQTLNRDDVENINPDGKVRLRALVSSLRSRRKVMFNSVCRNTSRFEQKYAKWLCSEFLIDSADLFSSCPQNINSITRSGRPSIEFKNKSDRSKRRKVAAISAEHKHDPQKLISACRYAARRSGDVNLSIILGKVIENPAKIRKVISTSEIVIKQKTPIEALAFILNNSMSKSVYTDMRLESISCGADIWPAYNLVRETKAECRPSKNDIVVNERKAEVSLQSLLNHTASRIIKMQSEVILQSASNAHVLEMEAVLLCSWGFDGSSGQSSYKQSYASSSSSSETVKSGDENLFATTLIPLRLLSTTNTILWNNPAAQSARFCRPIMLEYVQESREIVLRQKNYIEEQIKTLQVFEFKLNDDTFIIRVHFSLFLTLIDGKVLNFITNTKSMQTCPICHATPKQFNELSNKQLGLFLPDNKSLQYGISPLHAWIRIFECILHISYRINIKAWKMKSVEQKVNFAERKKLIQALLWEKLGLIVDKPKSGGSGTTNDGNTARRAFADTNLLSEILGIDNQLLYNLKTILIALSCHLTIDPKRFDKLCTNTASIYVARYAWYPMPSTLHKILIHGAEIISTCILPVGMLGEEGSEARNKNYKNYREFHSRKNSREANLQDVFYRAMDTSDPIISTTRLHSQIGKRKVLSLPKEVIDLLAVPEIEATPTYSSCAEDENLNLTGLSETYKLLDEQVLSDNEG